MRKIRMLLASFLAWGIICLPLNAAPAAMMTPLAGSVTLNGHSVLGGEAINSGDRIQTGVRAGARLVLAGSAILAGAGSRFSLESGALHLNAGKLNISGRARVTAASETIAAVSTSGIFSVTRMPGVILVRSTRGEVSIRGTINYTVPAGGAARITTQTSAAATGGGVSKGRTVAIAVIAAAVTGVVTGIIVHKATECNGCIVSPSS